MSIDSDFHGVVAPSIEQHGRFRLLSRQQSPYRGLRNPYWTETAPINPQVRVNLCQSQPNRIAPQQAMELMSMPTEIHYHIQSFLDHPSLLSLSATNKYFRALCPERKIKESLLCFEKCSLAADTLLTRKYLLPCYTCLKGLNLYEHFPRVREDEDCKLASEHASSRICATCLIATRPETIITPGISKFPDWIFQRHTTPGGGNCKLYQSRYGHFLHFLCSYWLACPKCNLVKRYEGTPHGRRRRYDEALLEGDMCAACYQPVWDKENAKRRERKNARARERYREKKEEARKRKEAAQQDQQVPEVTTASTSAAARTGLGFWYPQSLPVPIIDLTVWPGFMSLPTPMVDSTGWSGLMFGWDKYTYF